MNVSEKRPAGSEILSSDAIRKRLSTAKYGNRVLAFDRASSTNDIALGYAAKSLRDPDGTLVVAESQTRGRGRFGRTWVSPPYENLLFSLVVCPLPRLPRPALLTLAMSLSIVEAVAETIKSPCAIKWPNDVQLNGLKVAGVLTESGVCLDRRPFWVVGVGLNVNGSRDDFPADVAGAATTLRSETGVAASRIGLLAAILSAYERWCGRLFEGDSGRLLDAARRLTTTLGKAVTVRRSDATMTGVAFDLDDDGALLVRTAMGSVLTVMTNDDFVVLTR